MGKVPKPKPIKLAMVLFATIGVVQPNFAPIPSIAQAAAPDVEKTEAARQLAQTLAPADRLSNAISSTFLSEFQKTFKNDPNFKSIEKIYPGFNAFIIDWAKQFMLSALTDEYPNLIDRIANFYASKLTISEMNSATAFYESPLGKRLSESAVGYARLDEETKTCLRTGEQNCLEGRAILHSSYAAGLKAARELSDDELIAVNAFARSPAGKKIVALNPQMMAIMSEWANEWIAQLRLQIESKLPSAIGQWIAEQKVKKSS